MAPETAAIFTLRRLLTALCFVFFLGLSVSADQTLTDRQRIQTALDLLAPVEAHLSGSKLTSFRNAVTRLRNIMNSLPPDPVANVPPTVTLATNGATFTAPASITLTAAALDSDGTVAKVEFFSGIATLGEDVSAPFTFAWSSVPAGTYSLSARATDNAGATGTSAVVQVVVSGTTPTPPMPTGSAHDYFNALITRPECFKAYSFRPNASQTTPVGSAIGVADCVHADWAGQLQNHPRFTYNPTADTDPQRQDAVRAVIPVWFDNGTLLSADIDATTTTMTVSGPVSSDNGRSYKIGAEVVTQTARSGQTVTVKRAQFGTAAEAHGAGVIVLMNGNSIGTLRWPIYTDGKVSATYLLTWDYYPTFSYVQAGLINHKAFQIASAKSGQQWLETQTRFAGPPSCCPQPAWNSQTDVAAITSRFYSQSTTPKFAMDPGQPMASAPFILKPNRWTRFWVFIEANAEVDSSKFVNVTTLAADVTDPSATTISIHHPFTSNPFSVAPWVTGRVLRVGSEVMSVVSGTTTGTIRTITVVRGQQGTSASPHSAGAVVQAVEDYITVYVADESTDAVKLYDRVSLLLPFNGSAPGGLSEFWFELNTSQSDLPMARATGPDGTLGTADDFAPLVSYGRNFVMLKDPPPDWSAFRIRPVR